MDAGSVGIWSPLAKYATHGRSYNTASLASLAVPAEPGKRMIASDDNTLR
jgi:hypothetical protein